MPNTETAQIPEDISGRPRRMPVGGISWRHTFRALRHRNYRLFFWGQLVSLNGIAMGFDMPARQAFTVEMTSREDLLNAISLNSSIVNGARVIGPSLAGLMIGAVGVSACFLFNGLSFVAVIVGLLMMRLPVFERNIDVISPTEHAWNGIVYSFQHPRVRMILLLFLAVGIFGWSYMVIMPAFARDVLGRGADGYGVLMSASGVGALVGALVVATYGHFFT